MTYRIVFSAHALAEKLSSRYGFKNTLHELRELKNHLKIWKDLNGHEAYAQWAFEDINNARKALDGDSLPKKTILDAAMQVNTVNSSKTITVARINEKGGLEFINADALKFTSARFIKGQIKETKALGVFAAAVLIVCAVFGSGSLNSLLIYGTGLAAVAVLLKTVEYFNSRKLGNLKNALSIEEMSRQVTQATDAIGSQLCEIEKLVKTSVESKMQKKA